MEWSPQQVEAIEKFRAWYEVAEGGDVFYLAGFAGTGKSTVAANLAAYVKGLVLFGAFTGKAALVMRSKGCAGASTIHQLIYLPKDKSRDRLKKLDAQLLQLEASLDSDPVIIKKLKRAIEGEKKNLETPFFVLNEDGSPVQSAQLVVIDEVSMVDERIGTDLLSFGTPILVLGDPAQLPPICGGGYFTNRTPNVTLTEIHRQARDNPILVLATMARMGKRAPHGQYGSSCIVPSVDPSTYLSYDQILVGKNATRHEKNRMVRKMLGKNSSPFPLEGDKLVCLRNNHELGLLNGSLWIAKGDAIDEGEYLSMALASLDEIRKQNVTARVHKHHFLNTDKLPPENRNKANEFDYGYALTVHKSQGSQWSSVLLFDESECFRDEWARWLYTGITRAAERITITRK